MITTAVGGGHQYPWLARSWKWSNGNKTLTLNIAKGVKWSDGKPLTTADVVYTLTAGKQDKFLDQLGLFRAGTNVVSVSRKGSSVVINLKTPDSQFIGTTLNRIFVVPQHIWSKVADPATFTNPNPVGSGPFTKITRFTTQDYVLSKNPHYWQAGMPKIRDRQGGHGAAPGDDAVPDHIGAFALHLTAANIVMLVKAHRA